MLLRRWLVRMMSWMEPEAEEEGAVQAEKSVSGRERKVEEPARQVTSISSATAPTLLQHER